MPYPDDFNEALYENEVEGTPFGEGEMSDFEENTVLDNHREAQERGSIADSMERLRAFAAECAERKERDMMQQVCGYAYMHAQAITNGDRLMGGGIVTNPATRPE